MILGIQILGLFFGIFMLYLSFIYEKRKEFSTIEWLFWSGLWVFFIIISMLPNSMDFISRDILNMSRKLDFFIILGFMFLIAINFYNYMMTKKAHNNIEKIVRKIAIKKAKED